MGAADSLTKVGTVKSLTVEYTQDKRPQFWAEVVWKNDKGSWEFASGRRYLDEGTSETTMTLTMIQLLRDAMANGSTVNVTIGAGDKIYKAKVTK